MGDEAAAASQTSQGAPTPPPATSPNDVTMLVSKDGADPVPVSAQGFMGMLRDAGHTNVTGISQDGSRLQLANEVAGPPAAGKGQPTQASEMHIQDAARAAGLKIHSVTPPNASTDDSNVSQYLSGVIPSMATDGERYAFIRNHLKSEGYEDPRIVGAGSDWYNYEPDLKQWYQVTKAPSFNHASGWLNMGLQAPQMIGAGLAGGTAAAAGAGAGAGLASIPLAIGGGAAGGAAGSAAGQGITKAALAAYDPDYRKALNGSEEANFIGNNALKDAAVMGIAGPAGQAIGPIARGAGKLAEGLGTLTEGVGKVAQIPAVSEFVANSAPNPVGALTQAAEVPQLAQKAVTGVPKLMQKIADSRVGQALLGEENAARLGATGEDLLSQGNSAAGIGKAIEQRGFRQAAQRAAEQGLGSEENWQDLANAAPVGPLQTVGQGLDTLSNLGEKISQPFSAAVRGTGRAIEGVGAGIKGAGIASPYVGQALQYYGLPELGSEARDRLIKRYLQDKNKN